MERINRNTRLTSLEKKHIEFMAEISRSLIDAPMVLKGGTALILAYGLDRYSDDLDFDSSVQLNLEKKIQSSAEKQNIAINSIVLKKDTKTTKRYIVAYQSEEGRARLKIETSFRDDEIDKAAINIIEGIKTYKIGMLVGQKLQAAENRDKVRDLYDISFLANNYGSEFSGKQFARLAELSKDPDYLVTKYKEDHREYLALQDISLDDLAVDLSLRSEQLMKNGKN